MYSLWSDKFYLILFLFAIHITYDCSDHAVRLEEEGEIFVHLKRIRRIQKSILAMNQATIIFKRTTYL